MVWSRRDSSQDKEVEAGAPVRRINLGVECAIEYDATTFLRSATVYVDDALSGLDDGSDRGVPLS